jgi:RND family efflux transporter MFP subunit
LAYTKIGTLVGQGQPTLLATVSLVDPIQVYFAVSEREVYALRRRANPSQHSPIVDAKIPVQMILEDGQVYPHAGRINFADRALDPGTGTLSLRAEFPNPDKFLRPGNYAKVKVPLAEKRDALLVSERALGSDQGGAFLLVVNGQNVVEQRPVQTGPKLDGLIVIEQGLKPDEQVIVKGLQRARPGTTVAPVPEAAAAAARPDSYLTAAGAPPAGPAGAEPKPAPK